MADPAGPGAAKPDPAAAPAEQHDPAFTFLGLKIVRRTDLLAATAFLLAMVSTIYQFWGFVRGPVVTLYPPDRVVLFFDRMADGRTILRLAGDLTLVNTGRPGRDAVLRDVDLTLSIDGKPVSRQNWLSFVRVERDGQTLKIDPLENAHPLQVPGGAAVSKTVSFAPLPEGCGGDRPCAANYLADGDALTALVSARRLTVGFEARQFGEPGRKTARCEITVGDAIALNLGQNGWHTTSCVNTDEP
jgi:hypothetical protein